MAKFIYKARYRDNGEMVKGYMEATSKEEVAEYLAHNNCLILQIKKALWLQNFASDYKLKPKAIILLCKELAIMLEAGLNMVEALAILKEGGNNRQRKFLAYTMAQLKTGNSLASIWSQEKFLPSYLISCIAVAEHTGLLSQAFSQAANYLEKVAQQREKLQQITIYPTMLFLMLNLVITVMMWAIVPTFKGIFEDMNIVLPTLTVVLFTCSDLLINYPILLIMPLSFICLLLSWRQKWVQNILLEILTKLPYSRKWLEKIWLVNFSGEFLLLYNAGIPLEENLQILASNTKSAFYQRRLKIIAQAISQGKSLYGSCVAGGIKESVFLQLVKVGEETGGLADTLHYAHKFLEQEVDQFISRLMAFLEPGLILIVGLLVGMFIFALIVPLFDIPAAIGV